MSGGAVSVAAARMARPPRPLRLGDRVACALFALEGHLDYRRGRIEAFSTKGRVVIRLDRCHDRLRVAADCVALEGSP